jgi:diadenosine tetraphosphate (Ap4A) HIT family hydrolase
MTHYRSRKEAKKYKHYMKERRAKGKTQDCIFCEVTPDEPHFVKELKYFKIIHNLFRYSNWDGQGVEEQLLLIPKKHIGSLTHLSSPAAQEYFDTITAYEEQGYHIYARGAGSHAKTIIHQHTHLIKPKEGKTNKFLLFINKPYIRLVR